MVLFLIVLGPSLLTLIVIDGAFKCISHDFLQELVKKAQ